MTADFGRRRGIEHVPGTGAEVRAVEVGRRLEKVREVLRRRGASGAFLAARRNFSWLTCGGHNHIVLASETGVAPLLVTADEAVVLAPINEAARIADEELGGLPVEVRSLPWHEADAPLAAARVLATDGLLGDADLEEDLMPIRAVLGALDQERLASLGRRTGAAVVRGLEHAEPGMSEDEVASAAVAALSREGIRTPVVLAAADDRIERYRHPLPGRTPARRRLMLVLVAESWGLHAAVTRIREFDAPGEELDRRAEAVRAVEAAMHEATAPGRTLGDVFEAARQAYERAGFPDEWRLHHQGGTIGYQSRERVALPGDPTRIEPGMAFAWNPSITGAKAEDTFILEPDGSRRVVTSG